MIAKVKKKLPPFQIMPTAEHWEDALLASSIERFGVLIPILIDEKGKILDGHRRKATADRLKKECPSIVVAGLADEVKASVALETNLVRRIVKPREVIRSALFHSPHIADNFLAELLGTSDKTVRVERLQLEKAKKIPRLEKLTGKDGKERPRAQIKKTILCGNAKEQAAAVQAMPHLKHGRRTMDADRATRQASRRRKIDNRCELVKQARQLEPDADFPVYHCRFQDLGDRIADGSIDLVYTDPPWMLDWIGQADDLGAFAARVLKPGGILAVVYGVQANLLLLNTIDKHLGYRRSLTATWTAKATISWEDQSPILNKKRDIFLFCKGDWRFNRCFADHFQDDSPDDEKKYHDWQQRLGYTRHFVEMLTEPGYRVCDPMAGSGTTGVACKQLDRRSFIGCDCDEETYRRALLRLSETALYGASPSTE